MDNNKLKEILFSKRANRYCVLDGAAVPDLPLKLYETQAPNYCLFRGKLPPDVVHAAPYVIALRSDNEFTDWVIGNFFGKHWGIFAHSRFSLTEMRRHFRSLLTVHDEKGNPLIFRFYDPRVFRPFLPTCEPGELKAFFGKVDSYFVEAEDSETLVSYKFENDALKKSASDLTDKE